MHTKYLQRLRKGATMIIVNFFVSFMKRTLTQSNVVWIERINGNSKGLQIEMKKKIKSDNYIIDGYLV